ncbi:DNA repair protein XRCC4 isoform X1 [Triticum urartu]|uniref:DNA repair protein XRCC4 isoform X1 n=1 Tax=Triticum urartu TaxID=4572 RepID=UPI002044989C|nr:DNA repair protein XRCC4 isoform X1 [Triticum urartu]
MATAAAAPRHSCAKLSVAVEDPKAPGGGGIFVKATWLPTRFSLAVTDGAGAWVADASDAEVRLRAEQWDQPVSEYLALAERYLAFHQPSSTYSFHEAGAGRRLSWTFEKQGTKLEWRWKLQPAAHPQQTIAEVLDFLMDANIRLSLSYQEEVVRKTQSFEKVKQEAENCLQQSERFNTEKAEFEQASFTKFVAVLNSKKAKLRQLKDRIAALESTEKAPKEEEEEEGHSTDRTEPIEDGSDKDHSVNDEPSETGSGGDPHSSPEKSAAAATSRGRRGRKRTRK